jgi:hypothetical protein
MDSLSRSSSCLLVYSLAAETATGYGHIYIALCLRASLGWSLAGSPRFLGNPSCTFAPVSDPGRVRLALPFNGYPMLSSLAETLRTPTMRSISRLNNAASVLAVYASSSALLHSHARLASGWWLAFTGRDSNPLNSNKRFQFNVSHFLLFQIYPGATPHRSERARFAHSAPTSGG